MSHHFSAKKAKENGYAKPKNILEMSKEEKKNFLKSFDIVLADCDGVIWMLTAPIPNTGPAIMLLKGADKQFKFISNNSMRTDEDYLNKLTSIGVKDVLPIDLVHPVKTITKYIEQNLPCQPVFTLCCDKMNEMFRKNGVNIKTLVPPTNIQNEELEGIVKPNDKVAAVVLDLHFNITFVELARAHQYLLDKDCVLLVGASDAIVPVSNDFITLGSAGFMNMLSEQSNKSPIILGKPGPKLGTYLIENFHLQDPSRAIFIGDNLTTDIKFGKTCGFQTLFVLTGAGTIEQMLKVPDEFKPDYIANGLSDFIEFFKDV